MTCKGCKREDAYRVRIYQDGSECCDRCGRLGNVFVPDVFFNGPYMDEHLARPGNRQEAANGVWIESRAQKARLMREQGLFEVGDKVRGSRNYDPRFANHTER